MRERGFCLCFFVGYSIYSTSPHKNFATGYRNSYFNQLGIFCYKNIEFLWFVEPSFTTEALRTQSGLFHNKVFTPRLQTIYLKASGAHIWKLLSTFVMPGIAKLGPVELNKLETTDEHKSKSNLTEALKWPRGIVVSGRGLLSLAADHGVNGSHESDHDLAAMVRDFIENGSVGQEGNCHSSDSDTGSTSIRKHGESIKALKNSITPMESDLLSRIKVVIASIKDTDLLCFRDGSCKGSCIRRQLVKHLKSFGYNAAVCKSKWKVSEKVPGGEYEYMDVILEGDEKAPERLIIDIEFHSHFEIARPIVSYDTILKSLPVIYVGDLVKLERMLQLLVEAAKFSLKQNSMPIPPWRTLGYLRAKWFSSYERVVVDTPSKYHRGGLNMEWMSTDICPKQCQCRDQLRRLKASLPPEAESGRVLKAISIGRNKSILTDWMPNVLKS